MPASPLSKADFRGLSISFIAAISLVSFTFRLASCGAAWVWTRRCRRAGAGAQVQARQMLDVKGYDVGTVAHPLGKGCGFHSVEHDAPAAIDLLHAPHRGNRQPQALHRRLDRSLAKGCRFRVGRSVELDDPVSPFEYVGPGASTEQPADRLAQWLRRAHPRPT
jgi:hypothetical protein